MKQYIIIIILLHFCNSVLCQKNKLIGRYVSKDGMILELSEKDSFELHYGGSLRPCSLQGKWVSLNRRSLVLNYRRPKKNKLIVKELNSNSTDSLAIYAITEDSLPMGFAIFKIDKNCFVSDINGQITLSKHPSIKNIYISYLMWEIPKYKIKNSLADTITIKVVQADVCEKFFIKKDKVVLGKTRLSLMIPTLSKKRIYLYKKDE